MEKISDSTLKQLQKILLQGSTGMEYRPSGPLSQSADSITDREVLLARKRKHENALSRLRSLFLYGDEQIPEKEFIIERGRIEKQIKEIDEQLNSIQDEPAGPLADDEFIEKASYFIMVENLLSERYVDYEKYIRKIDQSIPRAFIRSIISSIVVTDGKVTSIEFKNGIVHSFSYK